MRYRKARVKIITFTLMCILILGAGVLLSSAFFVIIDNNKQENMQVVTGNIALTFSDGLSSFQGSLNFGESAIKTFTIKNTGTVDASADLEFENLKNTYIYSSLKFTLSYSETEDGSYIPLVENENIFTSEEPIRQTIANDLNIPAGKKYFYKLEITLNYLEDIDQTSDLNAILMTQFTLSEGTKNIADKIKESSHSVSEIPNFATVALTDEGVYQMEDDYGTSYYFRGAVENNYVKFAGFYWRIVRVNGDGTLRLMYDGTKAHKNGEANVDRVAIQKTRWNNQNNDAKYVGYMYSPSGTSASTSKIQAQTNAESSQTKNKLDEWYIMNIKNTSFDNYVADAIFCNDRSTPGKNSTGWSSDTGLGYGQNITGYGAISRLIKITGFDWITNPYSRPQLICPQKNDAFTVDEKTKGNGSLVYPVGLITADEVNLAGGKYYNTDSSSVNQKYYLFNGNSYWTMTPYNNDSTSSAPPVFSVSDTGGNLGTYYVGNEGSLAPVINISKEYIKTMIGSGTMEDPYRGLGESL